MSFVPVQFFTDLGKQDVDVTIALTTSSPNALELWEEKDALEFISSRGGREGDIPCEWVSFERRSIRSYPPLRYQDPLLRSMLRLER